MVRDSQIHIASTYKYLRACQTKRDFYMYLPSVLAGIGAAASERAEDVLPEQILVDRKLCAARLGGSRKISGRRFDRQVVCRLEARTNRPQLRCD